MAIRVDMTGVETRSFDPLPSGWYTVRVTDGEMREAGENAKNPGSQYINWEFTVQGGDHDGRKVWTNTTLLPQALFSLKGLLDAVGLVSEGEIDFEIDDVVGKELAIKLSQRQYNGDTVNDVKSFKKAGEQPTASSDSGGGLLP